MSSQQNGTLYIGVTNNLVRRVYEHKNHMQEGFTAKYNVNKLVYYEIYEDEISAISREKRLKKYNRKWKKDLIESVNPSWIDLYDEICK